MVTEAERKAFEKRKARILKEVYRRGREEGLEPRPSIHDRWRADAKIYEELAREEKLQGDKK